MLNRTVTLKHMILVGVLALAALGVAAWQTTTNYTGSGGIHIYDHTGTGGGPGNLLVGNGTPGSFNVQTAHENAYVEGILEVDGDAVVSGGLALNGITTYATTSTAKTLVAGDAGTWITSTAVSDDPVTFNLPELSTVTPGTIFIFVDMDGTAAADVVLNPDDADVIDGQAAGVSWNITRDVVGANAVLMAVNSVNWAILSDRADGGQGS